MGTKFHGPSALEIRHDAYVVSQMDPASIDRDDIVLRGLCHKADLDPEVFFPIDDVAFGTRTPTRSDRRWRKAEEICGRCPVRYQCLTYAVANPRIAVAGVWGGRHLEERRQIARAIAKTG